MPPPSAPIRCPLCGSVHRQAKHGKTMSGSQKYRCHACARNYNPAPKRQGYPPEMRLRAVQMYVDGTSFRRIARLLEVNHQTVVNWVNSYHAALPVPPDQTQQTTEVIEMDELFTFVGTKKALPSS
jgi:transposase-like protein